MAFQRNYKKEYANYHSSTEQKKRRASRNAARKKVKKSGVSVAGKDVAHRNGNPRDNRSSNLSVTTKRANRSYARTSTARKKNPRA